MLENKENDSKIALLIISILIALIVTGVVWFGAAISGKTAAQQPDAVIGTDTIAISETTLASNNGLEANGADASMEEAYIVTGNGLVQFYFATGKSDLPPGSSEALLEVVTAVNSGQKAVISGFADATGSQEFNEELSKNRAIRIRDVLLSLNVPEDKIELRKPEVITGTGSAAQARRVEVHLIEQ